MAESDDKQSVFPGIMAFSNTDNYKQVLINPQYGWNSDEKQNSKSEPSISTGAATCKLPSPVLYSAMDSIGATNIPSVGAGTLRIGLCDDALAPGVAGQAIVYDGRRHHLIAQGKY